MYQETIIVDESYVSKDDHTANFPEEMNSTKIENRFNDIYNTSTRDASSVTRMYWVEKNSGRKVD